MTVFEINAIPECIIISATTNYIIWWYRLWINVMTSK